MKKILIYYPPNNRSIAIETLGIALHKAGNEVLMLTLTEKGAMHQVLEAKGIKTFSHTLLRNTSWIYFFKHSRFLRRFCKEHKIDVVLSHLQECNIISVIAKPFLKARLINFRHHAESRFFYQFGKQLGLKRNKKEIFLDKIINRLASTIIVPSGDVWVSMEQYEKADMRKVKLIPYIYDFSGYREPDYNIVNGLRENYKCKLLLIMVSRMIATKQHRPVFDVVNKLHKEGLSIKMLVMDDGSLKLELEKMVNDNQLQDAIIFTGFRTDFINYMAAADLLIHPSLTEASNNVVKEMGLLQKGVAVCKDVGDFNEYISEGENGFFLDANNLERSLEEVIRKAYQQPEQLKEMGLALNKKVIEFFSDTAANRQPYLDMLK